ncbi:PD-(D/E)XK nuclease [Pectobacterium punjabense]|uniref:PD-(D/E)XK nuclease n=1 Tax=Pectobacterium punjabense TaxID=2108399 RepID=A0ABX6L5F1_9GAMM|nr:PD-(D/E)XK nuclease family protein [Pectobacterium punjabense]MBS4431399.1 PD-(D/E)XK nuclease family protein [Pectobacterium punjabense]PTA64376.1 PD-(D/E)XK nuclease [Pectobacterium punjabense]QJA21392.1 PD-(D/E)XK nuclease [Pectobacterium punjabense]
MEIINTTLVDWLPAFFKQWPKGIVNTGKTPENKINIDPDQLKHFFSNLAEPLKAVQHRSLSFDPWNIAGLKRNEVRNSAVLAWLLNPEGTHGFGALPLNALLTSIRTSENTIFPSTFERYCWVDVETIPNGDSSNRVDIEIDAGNFFLLIEVKIDAYEQDQQIARYCQDAEKRAGGRPWAVVFLTPHGGKPLSGDTETNHYISCLSWRNFATKLESSMQGHYRNTFIAKNMSPTKQMAAHAAFCFLEHMRQF